MSKKKLLEEGTVRQFMKLANLKPLSGEFITENYGDEELYEQEEEELEGEELPPEAGMDMAADEEAPMDDMDMDMEMGDEEGALAGVSEEAVEELISVVADALASATGVDIDVTGGEDMEGEEAMDDFAPAEEVPADEEAEVADEEEEMLEGVDVIDEEAIMQETFRRVSNRLSNMSKEQKLVEAVTAKVLAKISK